MTHRHARAGHEAHIGTLDLAFDVLIGTRCHAADAIRLLRVNREAESRPADDVEAGVANARNTELRQNGNLDEVPLFVQAEVCARGELDMLLRVRDFRLNGKDGCDGKRDVAADDQASTDSCVSPNRITAAQ